MLSLVHPIVSLGRRALHFRGVPPLFLDAVGGRITDGCPTIVQCQDRWHDACLTEHNLIRRSPAAAVRWLFVRSFLIQNSICVAICVNITPDVHRICKNLSKKLRPGIDTESQYRYTQRLHD